MADSLDRLFAAVQEARDRNPSTSRTSKLFRDGVQKMAKKLVEEAIEVGLDAVQMAELDRRERVYGIAEKLPKRASVALIRRMAPWAARRKAS